MMLADLHVSLEERAERLFGHLRGDEHGGAGFGQVHQAQPGQLVRLPRGTQATSWMSRIQINYFIM